LKRKRGQSFFMSAVVADTVYSCLIKKVSVPFFFFLLAFALFAISCAGESKQSNWSFSYSMTGGLAGYNDKVEISSDGSAEYFHGREKITEFELQDAITEKVAWMVGRDDLLAAVGEYKGGMDVMDDIKYTITIVKSDRTYKIEWDSRSNHPAVLDEIRPTLDDIIKDARKLIEE